MPSGELDYDNVRTAEEFVEAVGGADYAIASDSSSWVLLMQDVYLPQDITMTGNFSDQPAMGTKFAARQRQRDRSA